MNFWKSIRIITDFKNLRKFIISYICFYVPIRLVQSGSWVNCLETNDDQCFLVNLSILITILDVIQAESVGIPCWRLSKLTSLNLILPKMLCSDPSNPTIHLKSASANILWFCGGRKRNSDPLVTSKLNMKVFIFKNFTWLLWNIRTRSCKFRTTFISKDYIVCELIASEKFYIWLM